MSHTATADKAGGRGLYGLAARFEDAEALLRAAERTRDAGFARWDTYAPYPIEDLPRAMGLRRSRVPLLVLLGAIVGGCSAYFMQYYTAVIDYPFNAGGKPLHSWPMFIPITFELAILGGGLFGAIGMILLNGLPMPYHPMFNVPGFEHASQDAFFLCIESADPRFDPQATRAFLQALDPMEVLDVQP